MKRNGFLTLALFLFVATAQAESLTTAFDNALGGYDFAAPSAYKVTDINNLVLGAIVYEQSSQTFRGYTGSGGGWVTLSPPPGANFFVSSQVNTASSTITSTSFTAFSNSPGLTFTPTVSGTYKIYSSVAIGTINSTSEAVIRIHNTSGGGTLLNESQATSFSAAGATNINIFAQSVFTLTAGTTYVFDIEGKDAGAQGIQTRGDIAPFYVFAERAN